MRVVIAEDNVLLAEGLELILTTRGLEVAAVAGDAPAFLDAVDEHRPDVAVVDVRLPPDFRDEGIRAALEARARHPRLAVLVLSQYVEQEYARELIADERGAVGYLLKDRVSRVSAFVDAVTAVAEGGTVMDEEVIRQLLAPRPHDPLDRLTPRELEVLALMASGQGNGQIGERLFVTENAVHKHIGSIFTKLGLDPTESRHRRVLAVLTYLDRRR